MGVCGYTLNGGLSGYFGKRLGMLGQRVVSLEIVLADGSLSRISHQHLRGTMANCSMRVSERAQQWG